MNAIRQTALLNKRELENATPPSASWHTDYRDTAWVYIGGLPLDLTEGDVVTIFSQFGNPTHLNLIRDKETGKLKGFGFLKYEDQRSCDLAVDNLGGAEVLGRMLRVDHTRYKRRDDEDDDTHRIDRLEAQANGEREASDTDQEGSERGQKRRRKMLKEERELDEMLAITADGEDEDPMRQYMIDEKREEVRKAREKEDRKEHKHRHHHRRRRDGEDEDEDSHRRHRHKHRRGDDDRRERDRSPRENGRSHRDRRDRDRSPKEEGRSHRERRDRDRLGDRSRDRRRSPSRSRSPRRRSKYHDD
jgi:RNA-binding motif protein, X-linked 2